MKRGVIVLFVLLAVLLVWLLFSTRQATTFSGTLRDSTNKPVAGADVTVGGSTTKTDDAGRFQIKGRPTADGRWVLDVRRAGYAPISKVFTQGTTDIVLTTVTATTQTANASSAIVAIATGTNCLGAAASNVDWASQPAARFPQVIDASGSRVTGTLPAGAQKVLSFLSAEPPCNSGFQVSIPANSLVIAGGQKAQGQVQIDVSTVDLYSADGMPGDYTVAAGSEKNSAAFMESFGAGTITVRSGNDTLQLAQGAKADIQIPVDPGQLAVGAKPPSSIPLLQYDPKNGTWGSAGTATLDAGGKNYIGSVAHFSEFNADDIKTNPACVRFDAGGVNGGTFDMVITAPNATGGFRQMTHHVQPAPSGTQANLNLHAVFNLPPNDWVALRALNGTTPIGTWILGTGPAWGGTGRPSYDYAACGTTFTLSGTLGTAMTVNGSGHQFGLLPKHIAYLVNSAGDVYPVGGGVGCPPNFLQCSYLFSIFDTGSTLVKLDSALAGFTGVTLNQNANWNADVRISGNGVLVAGALGQNPSAPNYNVPTAATAAAQANSGLLWLAPRNDPTVQGEPHTDQSGNVINPPGFVQVSYMLAGAPVTNKVVAQMDYTAPLTKGPWSLDGGTTWFTIKAPDIRFFQPGAAGIPSTTLRMLLEGFGTADPANQNGSTDQRHFLQNVTFTKGTNNVFDDQSPASPKRFFYDSGTTFTVISQAMATALGATPAVPNMTAQCSSNNTANFVTLDSIVIVGMDSANQLVPYRVNNAEVCVDVAGTVIVTRYPDPANPANTRLVDAIIGANLFDQKKILWNGPQKTLGIVP